MPSPTVETSINFSDNGAVIIIKVENENTYSFTKKNMFLLKNGIEKTGVKVLGTDVVLVPPSNNSFPQKIKTDGDLDLFI